MLGSPRFREASVSRYVSVSVAKDEKRQSRRAERVPVGLHDDHWVLENADERTRTSTGLPRHGPEPCASTNSATSARRREDIVVAKASSAGRAPLLARQLPARQAGDVGCGVGVSADAPAAFR
jgi:hypothetical protein